MVSKGEEYEVWENSSKGLVVIKKYNSTGALVEERLWAGRKIQLTPEERRNMQEVAAHDDLDVFQNGVLRHVKLLDDDKDTPVLKANLNAMSEDDMRDLFKAPLKDLKTKLEGIKNHVTLERVLEVGDEENANARQLDAVKARIAEVTPKLNKRIGADEDAPEGSFRAITPR